MDKDCHFELSKVFVSICHQAADEEAVYALDVVHVVDTEDQGGQGYGEFDIHESAKVSVDNSAEQEFLCYGEMKPNTRIPTIKCAEYCWAATSV